METNITNFQSCAGLEVGDEYIGIISSNGEALASLMNLQKTIQEEVYNYNFDKLRGSYKMLMKFLNWNYSACQDEWREFYTSLGGMSAFNLSFWKPWKKNHAAAQASSFEKLSDADKLESWFEVIDLMHFMFNIAISLNISHIDVKFFFWNPDGIYTRTMVGNESLDMMLLELRDSKDTIGKYNAIRFSNERLLDFVDHKHKVWQARMVTLFECVTTRDYGWYLGSETADKNNNANDRVNLYRAETITNWVEAFKALMHIACIIGMDAQTITNLYYSKNKENRERQQRPGGY
jgi:hypothetical protein